MLPHLDNEDNKECHLSCIEHYPFKKHFYTYCIILSHKELCAMDFFGGGCNGLTRKCVQCGEEKPETGAQWFIMR